ncbi:hypothetical protein HFM85_05550 [Blautia schinkii]|uniref:HdeD family acid-resistance protein n=1 Tax=Blautia schinkii TaxID=180164 RepID=UPI00156FC6A2|nr:DUF308 domain-containing protein [Blautia schinkii]NSG81860.1 hypothetical protein [Blautia schinkii]NSK22461.1 hypothetical protein [Blautia schinkii]NSK25503.1 hypothetical protein [Blautia schinkii]NSK31648.1 hypothetical protein [Blautia schinkii]NSK48790.1 hypothetical protein [Blautia schinkii]
MGEKINNILKGEIISSVFYVLLGLCLILIPTQTVDVICKVVFGLILIGVGIYHIYIYIRGKVSATIMDLLSGVVVFVLGVFLFMTPSIVIKLLPWMLGAFVLVDSLWKFKGAFLLKKGGQKSWSALLIGSLIFIALGIVILFGRFPKIMTLLIFSGWVLVCDGVVDIILFIVMKLGLRKIAKKATAENGDPEGESGDSTAPGETFSRKENEPQDAAETHEETIAEWAETPAGSEKTKKSGRKFWGRKKKDAADDVSDEVAENAAVVSAEKADSQEQSEDESENIYDDEPLTSKDAVTDGIGSSETSGKFQNTRWENEPQSAEMKLWDVGKDQVETGSLKEFLDNSDEEELEEWKD